MKNAIVKILVPIILLAGGILFLVLGFNAFKEIKTFTKIPATVTEVEVEYVPGDDPGTQTENRTVHVSYTYEGRDYNSVLQYASGKLEKGDQVTVLCNPNKPEYVSGATKSAGIVMLCAGAVLIIASIISFFALLFRR